MGLRVQEHVLNLVWPAFSLGLVSVPAGPARRQIRRLSRPLRVRIAVQNPPRHFAPCPPVVLVVATRTQPRLVRFHQCGTRTAAHARDQPDRGWSRHLGRHRRLSADSLSASESNGRLRLRHRSVSPRPRPCRVLVGRSPVPDRGHTRGSGQSLGAQVFAFPLPSSRSRIFPTRGRVRRHDDMVSTRQRDRRVSASCRRRAFTPGQCWQSDLVVPLQGRLTCHRLVRDAGSSCRERARSAGCYRGHPSSESGADVAARKADHVAAYHHLPALAGDSASLVRLPSGRRHGRPLWLGRDSSQRSRSRSVLRAWLLSHCPGARGRSVEDVVHASRLGCGPLSVPRRHRDHRPRLRRGNAAVAESILDRPLACRRYRDRAHRWVFYVHIRTRGGL